MANLYGLFKSCTHENNYGKEINVYGESINQWNKEFLVDFREVTRLFSTFGIHLLNNSEQLELGIKQSTGPFESVMTDAYEKTLSNEMKELSRLKDTRSLKAKFFDL